MLVGVGKADITPPAGGGGMAAYSVGGKMSVGVWGRLEAHAIVMKSTAKSDPIGLVAVDVALWDEGVSELVRAELKNRGVHFNASSLWICATHTHTGPANYYTNPFYCKFAGNEEGFDRNMLHRIVVAVSDAVQMAAGSVVKCAVHYGEITVQGLKLNRSVEPFTKNPEARQWMRDEMELQPTLQADELGVEPSRFVQTTFLGDQPRGPLATDSRLRCIVFVQPEEELGTEGVGGEFGQGDNILAVAAFWAMHPTCVGVQSHIGSADFVHALRVLSRHRVIYFNGAEGDSVAVNAGGGVAAAVTMGRALAKCVDEAVNCALVSPPVAGAGAENWAGTGKTEPEVRSRSKRVRLPSAEFKVPMRKKKDRGAKTVHTVRLGDEARPGKAQVGGSEEAPTLYNKLGFVEGVTVPLWARTNAEDPKQEPLSMLGILSSPFAAVRRWFVGAPPPDHARLGVVRIGPIALFTLPGEFTAASGRRIESKVAAALGEGGCTTAIPLGLCGTYISYWCTREEYRLQHYEGASTLYGPWASAYVGHVLESVARRAFSRQSAADADETLDIELPSHQVELYASKTDADFKGVPKHLGFFVGGAGEDQGELYVEHRFPYPGVDWATGTPFARAMDVETGTPVRSFDVAGQEQVHTSSASLHFVVYRKGDKCVVRWILPRMWSKRPGPHLIETEVQLEALASGGRVLSRSKPVRVFAESRGFLPLTSPVTSPFSVETVPVFSGDGEPAFGASTVLSGARSVWDQLTHIGTLGMFRKPVLDVRALGSDKSEASVSGAASSVRALEGGTVTFMTFNVKQLIGSVDVKRARATAAYVLGCKADVVMFQELFDERAREAMVEAMGVAYDFVVARAGADMGSSLEDSGLAIFVRGPRVHPVPGTATFHAYKKGVGSDRLAGKGIVSLQLQVAGGRITILNTHMQAHVGKAYADARTVQLETLREFAARHPPQWPIVFGGDFNLEPDELVVALRKLGVKDPTAPVAPSYKGYDRLLVRNGTHARLRCTKPKLYTKVRKRGLSDHDPVSVRIRLVPKEAL